MPALGHRSFSTSSSLDYTLCNQSFGMCVGCEHNSEGFCLKESRWAYLSRCRGEKNEAKANKSR